MEEEEAPPLAERLVHVYQRLAPAVEELGEATKIFTKPVADIEALLLRLQIGMTAWERFAGNEGRHGEWWSREIGYAKINRKWCLAIREMKGWLQEPEEDSIEEWAFHDAPRSYRIEALDKLPDLLEKLIKISQKTTAKLVRKANEAETVADALMQAYKAREAEKAAARPSGKVTLRLRRKEGQ